MVPSFDDIPFLIKRSFEDMSMIEEMLISPILAVMSVFRLPNGALINRGFIANFAQDINELIKILPRLPKNLPILVLKKKDQNNNYKQFVVNRIRVQIVLEWLCKNNPQYIQHGISLNYELIHYLPENGIPTDFNEIIDKEENTSGNIDEGPEVIESEFDIENDDEIFQEAFIENDTNQHLQTDIIEKAVHFPKANNVPINEYECGAICSLLFPKLFPTGNADPTEISISGL
jgi:hypothetical protein